MISKNWRDFFNFEQNKEYYQQLMNFVNNEYENNTIFPKKEDIFNAFKYTELSNLKVVIIGQDPYHDYNQAHGLAFSVTETTPIPTSLKNIYKELELEYNTTIKQNGDLTYLASQGVFLLNTVLTVRLNEANSHKNIGWETFTDNAIKFINENKKNIVYMLWGNNAISKKKLIDLNNNMILTSPHPSPLSCYRGFLGNNHFIKCNEYLKSKNISEIKWIK